MMLALLVLPATIAAASSDSCQFLRPFNPIFGGFHETATEVVAVTNIDVFAIEVASTASFVAVDALETPEKDAGGAITTLKKVAANTHHQAESMTGAFGDNPALFGRQQNGTTRIGFTTRAVGGLSVLLCPMRITT